MSFWENSVELLFDVTHLMKIVDELWNTCNDYMDYKENEEFIQKISRNIKVA